MLQKVVISSVVHVVSLRTIMHNLVISFSINYITTKINFVNTLLCQIKCYSKIENLHFCRKIWLFKQKIMCEIMCEVKQNVKVNENAAIIIDSTRTDKMVSDRFKLILNRF